MQRILGLFVALSMAGPMATQAAEPEQPSSFGGFSYHGTLSIGTTDMKPGPGIGFADVSFAVPLTSRVPLTFEFGTYLFSLDGKRPHETYGAFAWDSRYKLGALRPAYDAVLPSVFEDTAPFLAYSRAEYTRAYNTVEAMRRTAVPWGLSAEGSTGSLDWIVSVHDASKGSFRSASAALTWNGNSYRLMAAVESVWTRDNEHVATNSKVGGAYLFDGGEIGLAYLHPEANQRPDAVAWHMRVPLADRLGLDVMGEFTEDATDEAYGIAVDYSFKEFGKVTFAATDGALHPGLHATYTYKF
ncbi:hypothetical protein [Sagittula stellata]|nr:hypothetical protein [Sagittula stellata]